MNQILKTSLSLPCWNVTRLNSSHSPPISGHGGNDSFQSSEIKLSIELVLASEV